MDWIADIWQKFETLSLEANSVMHEETIEYVENQLQTVGTTIENQMQAVGANIENHLQTVGGNIENHFQKMGANIRQFYSGFMHDVLPPISPNLVERADPELSPRQNENIDLTAHGGSIVGIDIDLMKGLSNKNSFDQPSFVEPVEGEDIDSLWNQEADIGMYEMLNVVVMENAEVEKPFPTEIPVVADAAEEDSSMASLPFEVDKSDDERWDSHIDKSTPITEGYNSCVLEETANLGNAMADNLNALPPGNSLIFDGSHKFRVSAVECTSGDACLAVSTERADYSVVTEMHTNDHVIEPELEATQFSELNYEKGCVVIKICKACGTHIKSANKEQAPGNEDLDAGLKQRKEESSAPSASTEKFFYFQTETCEACGRKKKSAKQQQAPGIEDLDEGLKQQKEECSTPSALTRKLEAPDCDFCDSDWEII